MLWGTLVDPVPAVAFARVLVAMVAGANLTELLKAREAAFDQRFALRFGQLSQQDVPPGNRRTGLLRPVHCLCITTGNLS